MNGLYCNYGLAYYNETEKVAECVEAEKIMLCEPESDDDDCVEEDGEVVRGRLTHMTFPKPSEFKAEDDEPGPDEVFGCDPTNNKNRVRVYYLLISGLEEKEDLRYFEVICRCGLGKDVPQLGFMGNITGTEKYSEAIALKKDMLEQSNCHTDDRDNYEAQLDCNNDVI